MYDPNSPKANQLLSQSQPIIQNNFAQIQNSFDVNHYDFDEGTDNGKHMYVEMPAQSAAPPIVFAAGEIANYSFLSTITGVNELYVNKTNEATVVQIPTTASILSTSSNPGQNVSGWTYLPSGILLKWGNGSANGSTNFTFPVSGSIPAFTNVMSMQVCTAFNNASDANGFARLSSYTNLGFNVYGSFRTQLGANAVTFQYLAIGY